MVRPLVDVANSDEEHAAGNHIRLWEPRKLSDKSYFNEVNLILREKRGNMGLPDGLKQNSKGNLICLHGSRRYLNI